MRRIICLLCILALALCVTAASAAAEDADFTLRFILHPEHFPDEMQPIAEGLSALCEVSVVYGHYAANGDAFVLSADAEVNGCTIPLEVQGVPSHWRITSPALGATPLLINNLALLEFGLKAEAYLALPLQKACLLVPYAHTSAWAVLADTLAPLLPASDGISVLSAEQCHALLDEVTALAENDRTVRCYFEALGVQTADLALLAEDFTKGMTIVREGTSLRWMAADAPLMTFVRTDTGLSLDVSLNGLTILLKCDMLPEECLFSLDAEGVLLEGAFHVHTRLVTAPDCLSITVYNAVQEPMLTLQADLEATDSRPFPVFSAATLDGVNLLSVNGGSLAALMADVGPTLLPHCLDLVAACPAAAVQALMDALDSSGVIPLLTDAFLCGNTGY